MVCLTWWLCINPYPADCDRSPIYKQLGSGWDVVSYANSSDLDETPIFLAVWHLGYIFTTFEQLWSTSKIEADRKFSRQFQQQDNGKMPCLRLQKRSSGRLHWKICLTTHRDPTPLLCPTPPRLLKMEVVYTLYPLPYIHNILNSLFSMFRWKFRYKKFLKDKILNVEYFENIMENKVHVSR